MCVCEFVWMGVVTDVVVSFGILLLKLNAHTSPIQFCTPCEKLTEKLSYSAAKGKYEN